MPINCPHCGYENPDTSSFCSNCAESIIERSTKRPPLLQQVQSQEIKDLLEKKQQQSSGCFCCLIFALIVGFILFIYFILLEGGVLSDNIRTEEKVRTTEKIIHPQDYQPQMSYFIENIDEYSISDIQNIGFQDRYDKQFFVIYTSDKDFVFSINPQNELKYGYHNQVKDFKFRGMLPDNTEFRIMTYWLMLGTRFIRTEKEITEILGKNEVTAVCIDNQNVWIFLDNFMIISAFIETKTDANNNQISQLIIREKVMLDTLFPDNQEIPRIISSYYFRDKNVMLLLDNSGAYYLWNNDKGEFIIQKQVIFEDFDAKILASTFYSDVFWFLLENGKMISISKAEMRDYAEISAN